MKKVLSFVLVLAMILGSVSMVFASDYSDVKDTEVFSEAVNVLSGLGVVNGYKDGTYRPQGVVTRAEMATLIVNALGIPVKGGAYTKFSDVPASHWASGYIAYAVSVGFIAGYPNGTFQPEKQVSYNEAITMLVASLGYTLNSLTGDYPGAFINQARGLGILDTCKTTGTVGAVRGDVACLVYDTLDCAIGVVNKDDEFVPSTPTGPGSRDNMLQRLGASDYAPTGGLPGDAFVVIGDEDSEINLKPYIGAYITAYQNRDGEIIAIKEVKSVFVTGEWDGATEFGDYKVSATTLDPAYETFNNGDKVAKLTFAALTAAPGDLTLAVKLNGKRITDIYSSQAWAAAATFRADEDIQDEITKDQKLNGASFELNDDDEIDTKEFSIFGKAALSELAEDDIITYYLSGGKVVRIEVSTKTVKGEISKINTAGTKFTIDGTAYKRNAVPTAEAAAIAVGDEGTFFLDYSGKIYDFEATKETTSNYAVLLDAGQETGKYGGVKVFAKLFLADGTVKEFELDGDGVALNGGASAVVPTAAALNAAIANGSILEYTVDSDNLITELDMATLTAAAGEFDKNGVAANNALKSNTVAIAYDGGPVTDKDSYNVVKVENLYEADFTGLSFIAGSGNFKAVLISGMASGSESYAMFISKDATVADGNKMWTALYEGKVKEDLVAKAAVAPTVTTTSAATLYKLTSDSEGIVTAVTVKTVAPAQTVAITAFTKATSVSGSVFKAENVSYSLDANVEVYAYDDSEDEWTAGGTSILVGRASAFIRITLLDTDADGDYDIAIAIKN